MQAPVFDGYYRFVKGGIWKITYELTRINAGLGVRIETSSPIARVDELDADKVVLATDPVTARQTLRRTGAGEAIPGHEWQAHALVPPTSRVERLTRSGHGFPLHLSEPLALKRRSARRSRWWGR